MDIIRIKNSTYALYEEKLLDRDHLKKEAEHYRLEYIRVFGDLMIETFQMKIECIRKKKTIAFLQQAVNRGVKVTASELDTFISQAMQEYSRQLLQLAEEVKAVHESKVISSNDLRKIKKIYYSLAKKIHPDVHPGLMNDPIIKDYWQRIVLAYKYNQLSELEELELLVTSRLQTNGIEEQDIHIENIEAKIKQINEEIQTIISTDSYQYRFLLEDEDAVSEKEAELQKELKVYQEYAAQLDEIINTYHVEKRFS